MSLSDGQDVLRPQPVLLRRVQVSLGVQQAVFMPENTVVRNQLVQLFNADAVNFDFMMKIGKNIF